VQLQQNESADRGKKAFKFNRGEEKLISALLLTPGKNRTKNMWWAVFLKPIIHFPAENRQEEGLPI